MPGLFDGSGRKLLGGARAVGESQDEALGRRQFDQAVPEVGNPGTLAGERLSQAARPRPLAEWLDKRESLRVDREKMADIALEHERGEQGPRLRTQFVRESRALDGQGQQFLE